MLRDILSRNKTLRYGIDIAYHVRMPRLWNETIDAHRAEVREAILRATWQLVLEHGLLSVTMSQIAETTGIGRATLYKYFPNVEAILEAHHEQQVSDHLERLRALSEAPGEPLERFEAVLTAYAMICYYREQHGTRELSALLHRGKHVVETEQQIQRLFRDLLGEVMAGGVVRGDTDPDELAGYCRYALSAAGVLRSKAAVGRLVKVTLAGLRI